MHDMKKCGGANKINGTHNVNKVKETTNERNVTTLDCSSTCKTRFRTTEISLQIIRTNNNRTSKSLAVTDIHKHNESLSCCNRDDRTEMYRLTAGYRCPHRDMRELAINYRETARFSERRRDCESVSNRAPLL